jgi:murein DD-endopeptidase MepM/ murein hydrolase activator NlpD
MTVAWQIFLSLILLIGLSGCGTTPAAGVSVSRQAIPALQGSYHTVRRGETLWRIANSYGLDVKTVASANRLPSAGSLKVGQQLFIPLPPESDRFVWPVRGVLRNAGSSTGIEIAAASGSLVRASRSGHVAVAARNLSGLGKTVVLDHRDGHLSVYAGLEQILVAPGAAIRQGVPLGTMGSRSLYFEIRYGTTPKNTLALLPVN